MSDVADIVAQALEGAAAAPVAAAQRRMSSARVHAGPASAHGSNR